MSADTQSHSNFQSTDLGGQFVPAKNGNISHGTCCLCMCAQAEGNIGYVCVHEGDIWLQQPAPHPTKPQPDIIGETISRGRKEYFTLLHHGLCRDNSNILPYLISSNHLHAENRWIEIDSLFNPTAKAEVMSSEPRRGKVQSREMLQYRVQPARGSGRAPAEFVSCTSDKYDCA